jgi:hypothetical protein
MDNNLQNYIPYNSVLNPDNTEVPGDFSQAYSLIDWLKNLKISSTDTASYISSYNKYLNEWFDYYNVSRSDKTSFVRLQYINLLKEISLKYTTPDEKRFLSNINFDDNQSLDIAIPFFTKKIKKICQYYAQKRDTLTTGVVRSNLRGSDFGIETLIKKAIVSILQNNDFEPTGVRLPALSSVLPDFHVQINDAYDTQQYYFDIEPGSKYESYDVQDPERKEFFNLDSTLVDDTSIFDLNAAIIEAIESYPFFLKELGLTNFTVNFNLSTTNYSYLDSRDFQNYDNNSEPTNTNVYEYKKLYERNLGNKLVGLSGQYLLSPLSSYVLIPTYPYQNILNRRFPTVAHIPEITSAQREKYLGNFFTKDNLGILFWNTYKKEYSFSRFLSAGEVILIPDPEVGSNASGLSLFDQTLSGIDYQVDLQWNRYDWSNDYAFGKIYSEPKIHKFFAYTGKNEISEDSDEGVSRVTDYQDFWNDNIIWRNRDVFEFSGDDYYPLDERKKYLLYNKGILTKYKTDIFGNHYGLFKNSLTNSYSAISTYVHYPSATSLYTTNTSSLCSLYAKQNFQPGQVFVRSYDDTKVLPLSSALSGIFIKYPTIVRNELENSIIDMELIFNTIVLETSNYIVLDKINFDFDTNTFNGFYTKNTYFKKYNTDSNIENYSNFWYDDESNNIFLAFLTLFQENSSTSKKIVYPKVFAANIQSLNFTKIYPINENIQSLSSFIVNLSSENFNLSLNDRSLMNISHESQILGILVKSYNKNGIPILNNYKFKRSFNTLALDNFLSFKPCGFIYDRNYNDRIKEQTVRHISLSSSIVANQKDFNSLVCSSSSSEFFNYYYAASQPLTVSSTVSSFIVCDSTVTNTFTVSAGNTKLNLRDVYGTLVYDFSGSNQHYFTTINDSITAQDGMNIFSITYVASGQHVIYIDPR